MAKKPVKEQSIDKAKPPDRTEAGTMGSVRPYTSDWMRKNQQRYLSDNSPTEAFEAAQHVLAARAALQMGETEVADYMYRKAQKLWQHMENIEPGQWIGELTETSSERRKSHHRGHH